MIAALNRLESIMKKKMDSYEPFDPVRYQQAIKGLTPMYTVKNLEELREFIAEEKYEIMEALVNNLEDSTEYQRGRSCGFVMAYDEIMGLIRDSLKHCDDAE
jgi:hypothetical protein